ncbi:MAG: GNAT family N-acetyltransferase [Alphaproteobacteria bacterium]|nr:GNAT family N-acetyltransferase [Alphaproteobacteria bacterium]
MPFVPADFAIPQGFRTADFILRPLTIHDLIKDYDAVMSSRERLVGVFGPGADWPAADMSLEEDLVDLGWHQGEFDRRRSFAYTVMAPQAGGGEGPCLGCAYIYPAERAGYEAKAYCWVRTSAAHLDEALFTAFRDWIAADWPFGAVAYPGRDISWADWAAT